MNQFVQKIIEGIKDYVDCNLSNTKGWSLDQIEYIENIYMLGNKFPKAIRSILLFGGNQMFDIVEPLSQMTYLDYKDFYSDLVGSAILRDKIMECLKLSSDEYAVVHFNSQGDYVSIVRLCDGEDPPVYFSIYDTDSNSVPTFEVVASKFTDWFIDQVVEYKKTEKKFNILSRKN